jgi:glycosyltransferase involved in cell wall biosynthesis
MNTHIIFTNGKIYLNMLSVVIPTTRDITKLEKSLSGVEVLVQREDGLVNARNLGWRKAHGDIIAFIDDDIELDKNWVEEICKAFSCPDVGGVMGGVITEKSKNRDNDWSNPILKIFYNRIGAVSACNMAFRRSVLEQVGGFDEAYSKGLGEWSEPDLVYRVKQKALVITHEDALVWHYPSDRGIYQKRAEHSYWRMHNFHLFRRRWLKWDFNLFLVMLIFYAYWFYKFLKTRNKQWLGGLLALR